MVLLSQDTFNTNHKIRKVIEQAEKNEFSKYAMLSVASKGRKIPEEECAVRTAYQRDRDRILHSQSFRALKYKTNVFLSTGGEKFRTRLTHTLEVSSIARTICQALHLNHDLSEAIALGHDLGHTPFGHAGEDMLNEISPGGFHHSEQSVRVVELLEKNGRGLNLTVEVIDGILKHTKGEKSMNGFSGEGKFGLPLTLEGRVLQFADWIAYINHDIEDAVNMGLITLDDLPRSAVEVLGRRHSERINTMVCDIVEKSAEKGHIEMGGEVLSAAEQLRAFLYGEVYTMPQISDKNRRSGEIINTLYGYYLDDMDDVRAEYPWRDEIDERAVIDYIAGMTDLKAQESFNRLTT
ncbi:MAG: deoxyguanosinetriphosphate triphosphohydrolase [Elusimicrobia bacterium]|nr:deoxyguanosinetriphosphate triphosphohydrolase [Elusimicrobiota bacterium]